MADFNFVSPGAIATDALQKFLADQEARQRQAMIDKANIAHQQEQERLAREQAAREAELQAQNIKDADQQRQIALMNAGGRGASVPESMANTEVGRMMSEAAAPAVTDVVQPEMNPTKQQGIYPGIIASSAPSISSSAEAPGRISRGTVQEQATANKEDLFKQAGKALEGVTNRQEAMRRVLPLVGPEADNVVTTYMGKETVIDTPMRWDPKDGTLEKLDENGKWIPHKGPLPEHYKILNEKDPSAMGGGLSTKLFQDATGTYLAKTDASGNTVMERVGGTRPYAGQAGQITAGNSAVVLGNNIAGEISDEWIGPLAGRYNSLAAAYTDTYGPQNFRKFAADVSNYKNQAIKAITGAQMSEPEALRIMKSLPDVNLPPETFKARLTSFNSQMEIATTIAQMYAEGRKDEAFDLRLKNYGGNINPSAVRASEDFLKKTYPNVTVSQEDVKKSPTVAGGSPLNETPDARAKRLYDQLAGAKQ